MAGGIVKNTISDYAKTGVDTSGVLVNRPCEVVLLKATSGGGAAVWELYDSASQIQGEVVWILDSSQQNPDINPFSHPLRFRRGIYARQVQGAGFTSQVFAAVIA